MTRLVIVLCLCLCLSTVAEAGEVNAVVKDEAGHAVEDAVVVAAPERDAGPVAPKPAREVVDQVNRMFVPYVKAVVVGSAVYFPNKDDIRHHVYSFSPVKTFELPLYTGTPARPVVFDRPGLVTIGCNIHDWMIGYIYVAETPHFGKTARDGKVRLEGLPPGPYTVRVWHPRMQTAEESTKRAVTVAAGAVDVAWQLALREELRPRRAPVPGSRGYR